MVQFSPHGPVMSLSRPSTWHFDIDRFINPFLPAPRWHLIPKPLAHMLGHRENTPKSLGNIVLAFWSVIGVFCGLALVAEVSKRVPSFESRDAPTIIGSFGAAAVLEFCAIDSPFSQPRNAIFSQIFACTIGVGISKLFALSLHAEAYIELGGALACALTVGAMVLTNTVHPPAGATSLLAVTNSQTAGLGWFLFPVILLGIALMQAAALLINNIQRRFPLYWWTSHPLALPGQDEEANRPKNGETSVPSHYEASLTDVPRRVVVEQGGVLIPDGVYLSEEERRVLMKISERL
ncbi:hypothetical protein N7510_003123 [Penicillium lagena]|uniref:uncharacterized protein n=1 Tax=Penicillium lagena TaxID=94218 RepID=UPI002541EFE1|nr:uncharacterized protein N7510_003123 [Penicillium lagena]KAJ5619139.1 hypothetical protein N7510_003123 [Penicillium lagena]